MVNLLNHILPTRYRHVVISLGGYTEYAKRIVNPAVKFYALNKLPMQVGDVVATYADIDDLQQAVGFTPQTPLPEGIAKFVQWYKEYYRL